MLEILVKIWKLPGHLLKFDACGEKKRKEKIRKNINKKAETSISLCCLYFIIIHQYSYLIKDRFTFNYAWV